MLKRRRELSRVQLGLFREPDRPVVTDVQPDSKTPSVAWPGLRAASTQALWICIRLPLLALEALKHGVSSPAVVTEEQRGRVQVWVCNQAAQSAGIQPGQTLNTARALLPGLQDYQREPGAEQLALHELAEWALGYTPLVSVEADGVLLLEISSSLRLFDGLDRLHQKLRRDLQQRGHQVLLACAPDAKAALWLASAGKEVSCVSRTDAHRELARLRLHYSGWPAPVQQKLQQMGVRTLGECIRLPRDGFARRIGPVYLQQLDQAFGRATEIRALYQQPMVFRLRTELLDELTDAEQVINVISQLLLQLKQFLRQRQLYVQRVCVRLEHYRRAPTVLQIRLSEPGDNADYLLELLRLQFARQDLPAPVTGTSLEASKLSPNRLASGDLPGLRSSGADDLQRYAVQLIERLRARLGNRQVYGLNLVAEHRPELAWQRVGELRGSVTSSASGGHARQPRPLWLLTEPRYIGKTLSLGTSSLCSVERIESGWWDGHDVRRDYLVVNGPRGSRWWVFRDCRDSAWYLHGLFG